MAQKSTKKRRLKGSVRKSVGAVFMAAAILVAAIPVEHLGAAGESDGPKKVTVDSTNCGIPKLEDDEEIYTTGDGLFQFAYATNDGSSSSNKVAIILGYDGGFLQGGSLTIPDTVDAYKKYSDNLGTTSGYCAVSKNGNFLFYQEKVHKQDENGEYVYKDDKNKPQLDEKGNPIKDDEGNIIYEKVPVYEDKYNPCYYSDRAKWQNLGVEQYYYEDPKNSGKYLPTTTSDYQPIRGAIVRYIGNQYLVSGDQGAGSWKIGGVIEKPEQGVFYQAGNIINLRVGEQLSGVGNYAFYRCTSLRSITLGNGLDTIGNYAFAECINMNSVNVDLNARISIIGDHAFYNCAALRDFTMPVSVTKVGDYAFAKCDSLEKVDLCGGREGLNVALSELGYNVFQNCASLQSVEFPKNYSEELEIGMWEGCSSLKFIKANNDRLNFVESKDYTFQNFKECVPKEFYFEGTKDRDLHKTASDNYIAFKYIGEDIYEILVEDPDDPSRKALYQVNSRNQLQKCEIPAGMAKVGIPETVGPYKIETIWGSSFQNNCHLKEITIPSSVLEIQAGAFKGCHNLETVYFAEPVNLRSIGDAAFQTQDYSFSQHLDGCPTNGVLPEKPELYFVGPVDAQSAPFQYAMKEGNKLNVGNQQRAYITYCSGWPTNLLVQYDPATKKSTLISYPTFTQISNYDLNTYPYLTAENVQAASQAVAKYLKKEPMKDGEMEIVNAALAIEIPYGVEAFKSGLFTDTENADTQAKALNLGKTLSMNGIKEIPAHAFKDCTNFAEIHVMDSAESIGDGAFEGCKGLTAVTISDTVKQIGKTPFYGCDKLNYVNFMNSPYFSCPSTKSSMIYQLNENGDRVKVVELLPGRANRKVDAEELKGVKELEEGAFMGTEIGEVDMSQSSISVIPTNAFAETPNLYSVEFSPRWSRVDKDAFRDSAIQYLTMYGEYGNIDNLAFTGSTNSNGQMTFYCEEGGSAEGYAIQNGINYERVEAKRYFTVKFYDYDGTLLYEDDHVLAGAAASYPYDLPTREGYIFRNWTFSTENIQKDTELKAYYEPDTEYNTVVVTFFDYDGTQIGEPHRVPVGTTLTNIPNPEREGYRFVGWSVSLADVQEDLNPHAIYEPMDNKCVIRFMDEDGVTVLYRIKVEPGETFFLPPSPEKPGKVFLRWFPEPVDVVKDMDVIAVFNDKVDSSPSPGPSGSPDPSGSPSPSPGPSGSPSSSPDGGGTSSKLYTLTVKNGLGTGSFVAGTHVVVTAQEAGTNQEFVNWTVDPADAVVTDKNQSAVIVTMPAANVTITANFRAKSGSTNNGNSGNNGTTTRPPTNSGSVSQTGTTVVIDKNGLSNTGVVSAVVNGSSDNFTIKIKEDANAAELALRALMAEYGEDLTGIKYFPMDISLYDSTGTKMITDTTGLSISITLPLPDSLIQYAGNNKVASVSGGKLEKLNPRFTTISGVSCVTFKAEHFSPYVIYVDTRNLTAGTVSDTTPKTGDGIHPKWFLSMGLASISVFLFLKRDRRVKKVPVRAR